MTADLFGAFLQRCRAEEDELLDQLRSHPPHGPMRVWTGRSADTLHEITDERVAQIERDLGRIEATIEFVTALQKALDA